MVPGAGLVSRDRSQCRRQEVGRCTTDWQSTQQSINIPSVSFRPVRFCLMIGKFRIHECCQRFVCDL